MEKINRLQPDIILTDIRMPKKSGLEVMEQMESEYPCAFIIFSGYTEFEYAKKALQMKAVDYLIKPVNLCEIEASICKAQKQIEQMKAAAEQEVAAIRAQAAEEGRQAGYTEGFARGHEEALLEVEKAEQRTNKAIEETEAVRDKLRLEYEEKLQEMEPMVIEELTEIYDHVFKAGLKDQKEIIFHLLDTTLHRIDSGREFIVRVSQTDYEYINTRKDALLTGMPGVRMDLVADVTMKRGEGIIETGGGLFDCSIDVELQELKNRIHMLAYQKE